MKSISISTKETINKVILYLLGLIGLFNCESCNDIVDEYGCPTADYTFKGKVIDENGLPIEGVNIIIDLDYYHKDSTQTNKEGEYDIEVDNVSPNIPTLSFRHWDYEPFDTTITRKDYEFKDGHGWYEGMANVEVNVTLKKK
ncbi:MAG: radical SAM-associated putative lipoprotein [Paludibacteraceae bacterium]|nr:radical SAM-associated putative lipoprotein [Paludibacteraceae bacterium]